MPLPSTQPGPSTDSIDTICKSSPHELFRVVNSGDKARLKVLLTESAMPSRQVNELFQGRYNSLSVASYHGHTDVLKILVRAGGDLLGQDADLTTPLFWAVCGGQHITVAYIIEAIKASFEEVPPENPDEALQNYINLRCGVNDVALYGAIQGPSHDKYKAAVVGLLIENGANVPDYCKAEADRLKAMYDEMVQEKSAGLAP